MKANIVISAAATRSTDLDVSGLDRFNDFSVEELKKVQYDAKEFLPIPTRCLNSFTTPFSYLECNESNVNKTGAGLVKTHSGDEMCLCLMR